MQLLARRVRGGAERRDLRVRADPQAANCALNDVCPARTVRSHVHREGREAVTDRSAFTADEWTLLRVTPSFVAVGVVAADASGLFASLKETLAGVNEVSAALGSSPDLELFRAIAADRSTPVVPDVEPLLGDGPKDAQLENFKTAVLERVSTVVELLDRKASPAETEAYRRLLAARCAARGECGEGRRFSGDRRRARQREGTRLHRNGEQGRGHRLSQGATAGIRPYRLCNFRPPRSYIQ